MRQHILPEAVRHKGSTAVEIWGQA